MPSVPLWPSRPPSEQENASASRAEGPGLNPQRTHCQGSVAENARGDLVDHAALARAMSQRLFSPVAERRSCEQQVVSSIPSGGLGDTQHYR
jgi:hypothetical protein